MSNMFQLKTPVGIELFCGVGGMSLGFERAGFRVAAALDNDKINIDTHAVNFPRTKAILADLSEMSGSEIRSHAEIADEPVDVVFGGPPCQGFSIGGVRDLGDVRNELLIHFARLVTELQPSYFVLENVAGLLEERYQPLLQRFRRRLSRFGYRVVEPIQALDAANFGVPQRRKRVFILGSRMDMPPPRYPSPNTSKCPTVWDAIGDLAPVEESVSLVNGDIYRGRLGRPSAYARGLRSSSGEAFPRSRNRGLSGFLRTEHSAETVHRFSRLPPGTRDPVSRFYRLEKDGVSPTQRAGTGTDRGSFMAPRPIHPVFDRCICLREAARLHSFPDWFLFHNAKWHGFRQIGNSVPPTLAQVVAAEILRAFQSAASSHVGTSCA